MHTWMTIKNQLDGCYIGESKARNVSGVINAEYDDSFWSSTLWKHRKERQVAPRLNGGVFFYSFSCDRQTIKDEALKWVMSAEKVVKA